jgi:hypothetical protein
MDLLPYLFGLYELGFILTLWFHDSVKYTWEYMLRIYEIIVLGNYLLNLWFGWVYLLH